MQILNESLLRPSESGIDTRKLLNVSDRGPHFAVKLVSDPNPKDNLHLRPNPLNNRKDIRSYHAYTKSAGSDHDPHR